MYLDTDILFALINPQDRFSTKAWKILDEKEEKYTSTTAIIELEFVVKREMGQGVALEIDKFVKQLSSKVEIKQTSIDEILLSLELRRKYNLGIMDSIHAAFAIRYDKKIASSDEAYDRVKELKRHF